MVHTIVYLLTDCIIPHTILSQHTLGGVLQKCENLPSSVINLTKEISIIILSSITILSQPKRQDEVMSGEKDGKKTQIINTEPFVGSLGSHGGRGGEDGGHKSSGDGGDCLHGIGLLDCGEGGLDNWGCLRVRETEEGGLI